MSNINGNAHTPRHYYIYKMPHSRDQTLRYGSQNFPFASSRRTLSYSAAAAGAVYQTHTNIQRLKGQRRARGTRGIKYQHIHTHSGPSSCHYCGHQAKPGAMNTSGAEHLSLLRPREVLMEP